MSIDRYSRDAEIFDGTALSQIKYQTGETVLAYALFVPCSIPDHVYFLSATLTEVIPGK